MQKEEEAMFAEESGYRICGPAATGIRSLAAVRAVPDQPADLIPGIE